MLSNCEERLHEWTVSQLANFGQFTDSFMQELFI